MQKFIKIHSSDNVAVALEPLTAHSELILPSGTLLLTEDIPQGHKFALCNLPEGAPVIKYAGEINEAENQLYENLDENDTEHLEMALTFYMYLNQLDDDTLFMANYSREEIVEGINSVSASFGITGFENFVDTTMV